MSTPLPPDPSWAELSDVDQCGMDHRSELLASHPGRPTPAEAVAMGVTPSSGSGNSNDYGPVGGPLGGGR